MATLSCRMGGDEFCGAIRTREALEDRSPPLRCVPWRSNALRTVGTFPFSASAGYVLVPQEASCLTTCIRKRIRRCSRSRWAASALLAILVWDEELVRVTVLRFLVWYVCPVCLRDHENNTYENVEIR